MRIKPCSSIHLPVAATAAPESAPDRFAFEAQEGGAHFIEARRPWSKPTRLPAEQVEKLPEGRVQVSPHPITLDTSEELRQLVAFQRQAARSVHALAEDGWRFYQQDQELGSFVAYQGLPGGEFHMLKEPLGPEALLDQALLANGLGQAGSTRKALEHLATLPRCAGLKRVLEEWEPALQSSEARCILYNHLLSNPWLASDLTSRLQLAQSAIQAMEYSNPAARERGAFAAHVLEGALKEPLEPEALLDQALLASKLGQAESTRKALERLATLPRYAGMKQVLEEWEPALQSREARCILYETLLSYPSPASDLASRQGLAQAAIQAMVRKKPAAREPGVFSAYVLEAMLKEPLELEPKPVAAQAKLVCWLGGPESTRKTLGRLATFPRCAGIKCVLEEWEPALQSREARRILHEHLLSNPLLGSDLASRQQLAQTVIQAMVRKKPAAREPGAFAAHVLEGMLKGPLEPEPVAAQALLASELGQVEAAEAAFLQLRKLPECRAIRLMFDDWQPFIVSPTARQVVLEHLLANLWADEQQSTRVQLVDSIVHSMLYSDIPAQEREEFSNAARQPSVRAEVEKLVGAERVTGIGETGELLLVGGVIVRKKGGPT